LTNAQCTRLAPLLPPEKPKVGKPNTDHRAIVNGVLWKLRTGPPWPDLPDRCGPWPMVYGHFHMNGCEQSRRLATRYDKRDAGYRAIWVIASTILWLQP
jgi:transposase